MGSKTLVIFFFGKMTIFYYQTNSNGNGKMTFMNVDALVRF